MSNIYNKLINLHSHLKQNGNSKESFIIKKIAQDYISTGVLPGEESDDSEDTPSAFDRSTSDAIEEQRMWKNGPSGSINNSSYVSSTIDPIWLSEAKKTMPEVFKVNQFGHTAFMDTNGVGYFFGDSYWIPGDITDVSPTQSNAPKSGWVRGWSCTRYPYDGAQSLAERDAKNAIDRHRFYSLGKGGQAFLKSGTSIRFKAGGGLESRTWPIGWEQRWSDQPLSTPPTPSSASNNRMINPQQVTSQPTAPATPSQINQVPPATWSSDSMIELLEEFGVSDDVFDRFTYLSEIEQKSVFSLADSLRDKSQEVDTENLEAALEEAMDLLERSKQERSQGMTQIQRIEDTANMIRNLEDGLKAIEDDL